jgi:hypothetical protein
MIYSTECKLNRAGECIPHGGFSHRPMKPVETITLASGGFQIITANKEIIFEGTSQDIDDLIEIAKEQYRRISRNHGASRLASDLINFLKQPNIYLKGRAYIDSEAIKAL